MPNAPSPITLVSGLPRSGTSLLMRMLEAGGMPVLSDDRREADEDNPRGYYEFEPVKRTRQDAAWVALAPGKAVKIVYKLLYHLPLNYSYQILMLRRRIEEVVASQNAMLRRLGQLSSDSTDARQMAEILAAEMSNVLRWLAQQPNFAVLEVDYNRLVVDPRPQIVAIANFLQRAFDEQAMCACVDPSLYRQRSW